MRLIDADEVKEAITEAYVYESPITDGAFDEFVTMIIPHVIDNIETNMPISNWRWSESILKDSIVHSVYYCLNCNGKYDLYIELDKQDCIENTLLPRYCPWCGVKIDKGLYK